MFLLCYLLCAEGSKDATLALVTPIPENDSVMQFNLIPEIGSMRAKSFRHSYLCTQESPDFLVPPSQVAAAKQNLEKIFSW